MRAWYGRVKNRISGYSVSLKCEWCTTLGSTFTSFFVLWRSCCSHWDFLPLTYKESSWSSQIWLWALFGECKPYLLLPSGSLEWASFLHRFLWNICTASNSGHSAEGQKEWEKALPRCLDRAEEIPVEKANTLLLSECSIIECLGQISLVTFSFVENWIQNISCFLNRVSNEPDSGVKSVECESHILVVRRTEAGIGCTPATNSGECRGRAGISWRHLAVQQKFLICSKAGKNHCLNVV